MPIVTKKPKKYSFGQLLVAIKNQIVQSFCTNYVWPIIMVHVYKSAKNYNKMVNSFLTHNIVDCSRLTQYKVSELHISLIAIFKTTIKKISANIPTKARGSNKGQNHKAVLIIRMVQVVYFYMQNV
jgi:hypothetical protein